jgi:hypothetical protein
MNNFTPAPWSVGGSILLDGHKYKILCNREDRDNRADIAYLCDQYPNYEANARLIAAAPDLLRELATFINIVAVYAPEHAHGEATKNHIKRAGKVIARVRGETPS